MSENDAAFVATIKGGQGYDAPWLVVRGDTANELAENVSALADTNLYDLVADAASLFKGAITVTNGTQGAPAGAGEQTRVGQAAPQAPSQQAAPAPQTTGTSYGRAKATAGTGGRGGYQKSAGIAPGEVPEPCQHGDRVYREGNGAKGAWQAWFCPAQKNDPTQCKGLFVRD